MQSPRKKIVRSKGRNITRRSKRPQHKRFLLHPITVFGLLCIGVFISGWTYQGMAVSYRVTGKVPAEPLTSGPTITSPHTNDRFKEVPVPVRGDCPDDSYINLYRNGAFSGSALCVSNAFEITTDLTPGLNKLTAKAFNITDDEAPSDSSVEVYYDAPSPRSTPGHSSSGTGANTPNASSTTGQNPSKPLPLVVTSNYKYQSYAVGTEFKWDILLGGGTPPYAVSVNWGDASTSTMILPNARTFTIVHRYAHAGYYRVMIQVADAGGHHSVLQIASLIRDGKSLGFAGFGESRTPPSSGLFSGDNSRWLMLAWPAYGMVVLMAFSFWLGERQELLQLAKVKVSTKKTVKRRKF